MERMWCYGAEHTPKVFSGSWSLQAYSLLCSCRVSLHSHVCTENHKNLSKSLCCIFLCRGKTATSELFVESSSVVVYLSQSMVLSELCCTTVVWIQYTRYRYFSEHKSAHCSTLFYFVKSALQLNY